MEREELDFSFPREGFPRYASEGYCGVRHVHFRGEEQPQFNTVEYGRLSAMVALEGTPEVGVVFRQAGGWG